MTEFNRANGGAAVIAAFEKLDGLPYVYGGDEADAGLVGAVEENLRRIVGRAFAELQREHRGAALGERDSERGGLEAEGFEVGLGVVGVGVWSVSPQSLCAVAASVVCVVQLSV